MLKIIHEGGGNSLINNSLDTYTHYIDDYSFLDVKEITNTPQDNEYLSSLGLSANTNLREYLPKGTKYTILAYKKIENRNDYTFHKQQEFTVGDINPKIELDGGQNYTLVVFSTGSNISPKIENVENKYKVCFTPNSSDTNFLHQKIENFIPSGDRNNVLDVKLKSYGTGVSIILDVSELLPGSNSNVNITSISNVRLTYYRFKKQKLVYLENSFIDYEEATLPIKSTNFLNNRKQYKIDFHDTFRVFDIFDFKFYADVKVEGRDYDLKIGGRDYFRFTTRSEVGSTLKHGYRQTFRIKPMVCGGYMRANKTNFREFMCYNFEDDYVAMWRYPRYGFSFYVWGKKATGRPTNTHDTGNVWREEENPCPAGYRVPTIYEWQSLLRNNSKEKIIYNRNRESKSGWKIGNRFFLFCDTRSSREDHEFPNNKDNNAAYFWSTTGIDMSNAYSVFVGINQIYDYVPRFKGFQQTVRCIKKLPNE